MEDTFIYISSDLELWPRSSEQTIGGLKDFYVVLTKNCSNMHRLARGHPGLLHDIRALKASLLLEIGCRI